MTDLAQLLEEANFDAWESVTSALRTAQGKVPPRVTWLLAHLHETKRGYWQAVSQALGTPLPPAGLALGDLMRWEPGMAAQLSEAQGQVELNYAGRPLSVAALVRLNARHSVWHAGQIAALTSLRTA